MPLSMQVLVHLGVDAPAVVEVERQEAREFMISAGPIAAGFSAWKYSEDSLWMKIASGRTSRIACIASTLALTMCLSAVTKAWSLEQLLVPPAVARPRTSRR